MRRAGLRGGIWTRRQNFEIAIALQRVGIDYDAAQLLRERQGQRRFAACGRTGNYDDAWGGFVLVGRGRPKVGRWPMRLVLTLIAAGPDHRLPGLAAIMRESLRVAAEPVWLAAEQACDLVLDTVEPGVIEKTVRALIGEAPIDCVLQPPAGRRKRLLAADLESTIIENEMLDELGAMLGLGSEIAEITRRAMNGEIDFAEALAARVALLAGTKTRGAGRGRYPNPAMPGRP